MAGRVNTRLIKGNKAYDVEELANVVGVSVATVRAWIKDGLSKIDQTRPTLIMGFQASDFLSNRKSLAKQPLAMGEFYCLRCKAPRKPFGLMADYHPTSATGGRLKALCGVCECLCNRNIRASQLGEISKVLAIELRGVE